MMQSVTGLAARSVDLLYLLMPTILVVDAITNRYSGRNHITSAIACLLIRNHINVLRPALPRNLPKTLGRQHDPLGADVLCLIVMEFGGFRRRRLQLGPCRGPRIDDRIKLNPSDSYSEMSPLSLQEYALANMQVV
ncbi:hypothetical protein MN608_11474 [Microdochium nivale]|nr:hypothetical protein MN608_11474 [Microdochium nivale]